MPFETENEAVVRFQREVETHLGILFTRNRDRSNELDDPWDTENYAKSLVAWQAGGHNDSAYYVTDDEAMIAFAPELGRRFGLKVVSHAEWKNRNSDPSVAVYYGHIPSPAGLN